MTESEINKRLNFFDETSTLLNPEKAQEEKPKIDDEEDLVQEKPEDYSNNDDEIINNESIKEDNNNYFNSNNNINNNIEDELKRNMKASETLKDSYGDKLVKNMDQLRKMINPDLSDG